MPCSMRFTGRPRPIRDDGFTRCGTRSFAETSCGGRGSRCARNDGAPGIDKITTDPRDPSSHRADNVPGIDLAHGTRTATSGPATSPPIG